MKILNLYCGIGGNRKLWNEVLDNIQVTAVDNNEFISQAYFDRFPSDDVIVADSMEYLKNNYKKFDFIWCSPPCQSHSKIRQCTINVNNISAVYPDMSLYQIIIFLKHNFKGKFVVENVKPYYEPLIKPNCEIDRHFYWSNFHIPSIKVQKDTIIEHTKLSDCVDFDISKYKNIKRKQQVIRNQVNYKVGMHIFKYSLQKSLF